MEPAASTRQAILDEEHLRLLTLGYWVSAGVSALVSLIGLVYIVMGVVFGAVLSNLPVKPGQEAPPAAVGLVFAIVGALVFAVLVAIALLKARAARCLTRRRCRVFCMVIGGLSCLSMPWGTVLGVCTLIVLGRPSVIALFESTRAQGPSAAPPPPQP